MANGGAVRRQIALLALVVLVLTPLFAKKPQPQHAPLPAKVLQGKTIFIRNDSGWAEMADKSILTGRAALKI